MYHPEDNELCLIFSKMRKGIREARSKLNLMKYWNHNLLVYLVQWRCVDITSHIVILMQCTPFALHYGRHRGLRIWGIVGVTFFQTIVLGPSHSKRRSLLFSSEEFCLVWFWVVQLYSLQSENVLLSLFLVLWMATSVSFPSDLSYWFLGTSCYCWGLSFLSKMCTV